MKLVGSFIFANVTVSFCEVKRFEIYSWLIVVIVFAFLVL